MEKEKQDKIIYFAEKCLGKPYKYGAKPSEAPESFDCSSFLQYVYKKVGIKIPRTTIEQALLGKKVKPKKEILEAGDLIFMHGTMGRYNENFPQGIGHVAMYIGDNKIVQAKYQKGKNGVDGGKVQIDDIGKLLNAKDLVIIKRII